MKAALPLLVVLLALASCGPIGLAGDLAVGTAQVGLGATQVAVGAIDAAL